MARKTSSKTKKVAKKATKPHTRVDNSTLNRDTGLRPVPVALENQKTPRSKKTSTGQRPVSRTSVKTLPVKLLAGGNPQIAKGDGEAPVQAYLVAMPGWKSDIGRRLDALIVRTVPGVQKAVKWNTPFYGIEGEEGQGWFLAFHCTAKYIKVAFFRGTSLSPVPPVESTQKEVRYLHIHEEAKLNEPQFVDWVKQASRLPGKRM